MSKAVIRMNDLKPCPFCGGEAVISVDPDAVEDTQGRRWAYNAVCIRCCATSGLTYTPQNAKEAWNRREERTRQSVFVIFAEKKYTRFRILIGSAWITTQTSPTQATRT